MLVCQMQGYFFNFFFFVIILYITKIFYIFIMHMPCQFVKVIFRYMLSQFVKVISIVYNRQFVKVMLRNRNNNNRTCFCKFVKVKNQNLNKSLYGFHPLKSNHRALLRQSLWAGNALVGMKWGGIYNYKQAHKSKIKSPRCVG